MCGIAGGASIVPGAYPDPARVERMSQWICHRGPDGHGIWTAPSGRACLAHRRLAIIDLVSGDQPMISAETGIGLVFNGEIYNYVEERAALRRAGVSFRTESDTEVLLRLLEHDPEGAVDRLRGMFAFAAWDDRIGRLVLGRDRVGKKPLFYVEDSGVLYFASGIGALRAAGLRTDIELGAVDDFLDLGYIPAPSTIWQGVRKLAAGTTIAYQVGAPPAVRHFWNIQGDFEPFGGSYRQAEDELASIIDEAVSIRLRSDVPLGVFLSGGIDSSLVAAAAVRHAPRIQTFAIGFDVPGFDESAHAAGVAEHLGTNHHTFRVAPDLLNLLPELVRHFGEPYGDSSALPVWWLAQRTREHVKVALGGDGGDEAFAGYGWHRRSQRWDRIAKVFPSPLRRLAHAAAAPTRWLDASGLRRIGQIRRASEIFAAASSAERYTRMRIFMDRDVAPWLLAGELRDAHGDAAARRRSRIGRCFADTKGGTLRQVRVADMLTYLADDLMPKIDVPSMAHGLEVRAPLLDQRVIQFALSLPDEWLIEGHRGKMILRNLLRRFVPDHLVDRPKQGFAVPIADWFIGASREFVEARLVRGGPLLDRGWTRREAVERLLQEHRSGYRNHGERIYFLLILSEWLSQNT